MITEKEIFELNHLLKAASKICEDFKGEYIHYYFSSNELKSEFLEIIGEFERNEFIGLNKVYTWFSPDSEWYDFTGEDGEKIGNEIYDLSKDLIQKFESKDVYELIKEFQKLSETTVLAFKEKYGVDNLLEGLRNKLYPRTGNIKEYGIMFYAFHGIGITVHFKNASTDFDFEFFSEMRYDGFDLWRLKRFVRENPLHYYSFLNEKLLEKEFNELIAKKQICKPKLQNSTSLYFWTNSIPEEIRQFGF